MRKHALLALICGIAWLAVPVHAQTTDWNAMALHRTVDLNKASAVLNAEEKRFLQYGQDFAKDAANHVGKVTALTYFQEIAGNAQDEAHACRILLDIYHTVQSKSDRDAIRPIIGKEFGIKALTNKWLLKAVDSNIGFADDSSVGAEASRMRTDIHDLGVTQGLVALTLIHAAK